MRLIKYFPTLRPLNRSVSSSTSGAMFCCGTVGMSNDGSDGVKSLLSSVPASYAIKKPALYDTKSRRLLENMFMFAMRTIQSGDGAIIATAEMNGFSQSTLTVTVVS